MKYCVNLLKFCCRGVLILWLTKVFYFTNLRMFLNLQGPRLLSLVEVAYGQLLHRM